jgi:hypothetical protein
VRSRLAILGLAAADESRTKGATVSLRSARMLLMAIVAVLAVGGAAAQGSREAAYPEGYRRWVHIKSGWIGEGSPAFPHFGGMHHIYANAKALAGYRAGTFPRGSVLVFDVLATKAGPSSLETAERRILDVMEKTGDGWRFTEFNGDSHTERSVTTAAGEKACGACHAKAATDHVFSKLGDAG